MRATVLLGAGDVRIENVPDARLIEPTDAVVTVTCACIGDIAYYAPWGNLAIFYRDFGYSSGLVILGKIDGDMEAFNAPGSVKATIELVK